MKFKNVFSATEEYKQNLSKLSNEKLLRDYRNVWLVSIVGLIVYFVVIFILIKYYVLPIISTIIIPCLMIYMVLSYVNAYKEEMKIRGLKK